MKTYLFVVRREAEHMVEAESMEEAARIWWQGKAPLHDVYAEEVIEAQELTEDGKGDKDISAQFIEAAKRVSAEEPEVAEAD